jgi:hypothetical protein
LSCRESNLGRPARSPSLYRPKSDIGLRIYESVSLTAISWFDFWDRYTGELFCILGFLTRNRTSRNALLVRHVCMHTFVCKCFVRMHACVCKCSVRMLAYVCKFCVCMHVYVCKCFVRMHSCVCKCCVCKCCTCMHTYMNFKYEVMKSAFSQ